MAQDIYSKYQQPVPAPGASADADIYSRYQRPDSGTPPDAGAQMRQSAINKIPSELSGHSHWNLSPDLGGPIDVPEPPTGPGMQIVHGFERAAEPGFDNKAAGASGMIRGLGRAAAGGALPLLGAGLATAPLATIGGAAVGSAGAYGGGKLARLGAQRLGGGEGAQDLAQDVGEGVGGAVVAPSLLKTIGKGVQAPAAPIAENALGIRGNTRAFGATPGKAILEETEGIRPATIATTAQSRLDQLTPELEGLARKSTSSASLSPAIRSLDKDIGTARAANSTDTPRQLLPMRQQLTEPRPGFAGATTQPPTPMVPVPSKVLGPNGKPLTTMQPGAVPPATISTTQSPLNLLRMKRQFNKDFITDWSPTSSTEGTLGTARQAHHELSQEFNRAVPEGASLNQRIQSLIPVAKRAELTDLNANTGQRMLGRIAKPTGALTSAAAGFAKGGIPGLIVGLGAPEVASSPSVQMLAARSLHGAGKSLSSPAAAAASRLIPLLRSRRKEEEQPQR